jgi:hypothetical protein
MGALRLMARAATASMHIGYNEGKVCDAVLRRIEEREGAARQNCRCPERENHAAPVELVCDIGDRQFAVEHTGVEPFEGFVRLQNDALTHFRPLEDKIAQSLPATEYVELHMPLKATEGLRGKALASVQAALAAYVLAKAPALPLAKEGRYVMPILREQPPGVEFEVSLHRWPRSWRVKKFAIVQNIKEDLETARRARTLRACEKKYPKLAAWQERGARTVLILEDNDIQNTGDHLVADALLQAEQHVGCNRPDEVYLVTTFSDPWYGHVIRIDDKTYFDFSYETQHNRYWEIKPGSLIDALRVF